MSLRLKIQNLQTSLKEKKIEFCVHYISNRKTCVLIRFPLEQENFYKTIKLDSTLIYSCRTRKGTQSKDVKSKPDIEKKDNTHSLVITFYHPLRPNKQRFLKTTHTHTHIHLTNRKLLNREI